MKKEALFWKQMKNKAVQCFLCPHHCVIAADNYGICGVRKNEHGTLYSLIYQACSSMRWTRSKKNTIATDFYRGVSCFFDRFGAGVPSAVDHCQNYQISIARPERTLSSGYPCKAA